MAGAKDKKRKAAIRKQRSAEKKKARRKLKLVKLKSERRETPVFDRTALSERKAPEGFRTISASQAMMEYAKPIMEKTKSEEDLQGALEAAMVLWNYSLALERGEQDSGLQDIEKRILGALKQSMGMDKASARDFLDMMVARHEYLFPEDIQPRGTPDMFIRKEMKHRIRPIEEDRIQLRGDPVPPGREETRLLESLTRLNSLVDDRADWEEVEKLLSSIKDPLQEAFRNWLLAKGLVAPLAGDLADCLLIWLDFVYAYEHAQETRLDRVPRSSWLEFFHDFLLRKMMVDPPRYVHWPPALRLFYRYLHEKGLIKSPSEAERAIRQIEPDFYGLLRHQFS